MMEPSRNKNPPTEEFLPKRRKMRYPAVKPPLANTSLSRVIYVLTLLTGLLIAYYSYRIVQDNTETSSWWGSMAFGRASSTHPKTPPSHPDSVEGKINDLAKALGMPSRELASAIAVAVKNYVPPASLSSVSAKETGPAVQAMLKDEGGSGPSIGVFENIFGVEEP